MAMRASFSLLMQQIFTLVVMLAALLRWIRFAFV